MKKKHRKKLEKGIDKITDVVHELHRYGYFTTQERNEANQLISAFEVKIKKKLASQTNKKQTL